MSSNVHIVDAVPPENFLLITSDKDFVVDPLYRPANRSVGLYHSITPG